MRKECSHILQQIKINFYTRNSLSLNWHYIEYL